MATALLHDLIHNKVKVYVDDMIVKSKDKKGLISNLRNFSKESKSIDWDWTHKSAPLG